MGRELDSLLPYDSVDLPYRFRRPDSAFRTMAWASWAAEASFRSCWSLPTSKIKARRLVWRFFRPTSTRNRHPTASVWSAHRGPDRRHRRRWKRSALRRLSGEICQCLDRQTLLAIKVNSFRNEDFMIKEDEDRVSVSGRDLCLQNKATTAQVKEQNVIEYISIFKFILYTWAN